MTAGLAPSSRANYGFYRTTSTRLQLELRAARKIHSDRKRKHARNRVARGFAFATGVNVMEVLTSNPPS